MLSTQKHFLGLLDHRDVEVHDHRLLAAAQQHAFERLVSLALISWCGTNGGTQMKSPGPASAVNSSFSPQRMRALPLTT